MTESRTEYKEREGKKAKEKEAATLAGAAAAAAVAAAGKSKAVEEKTLTSADLEKAFKEYSVAEFFKRNRQMLGYTGKIRSMTTIVHEAVTNSLDACEDAKILPEITVEISELPDNHFKVSVEDNGTGVPKTKIGQAFAKLLAGTKFSQRMQKRGQQGIGISYATLFAQITTGKPAHVKTSTGDGNIVECDVSIDVKKNEPVVANVRETRGKFRGTRFEAEFAEIDYNRSEYSAFEYLRRTALANPHAQITLVEPNKEIVVFPRASKDIPKRAKQVLPHPLGITTSDLMDMASVTQARKLSSFFTTEFARFSSDKVNEIKALCPGIDFEKHPKNLQWHEAEACVKAFQKVKWISPDTSTLVPIGAEQITKSLKNLLQPEQMKVVERKPKVFRGGIPFSVEAAIAFGGKAGVHGENGSVKGELMRFANRVPLLFDAGNCAITEAVKSIDWARYDLKDWENMPVSIFVNFVSVYVPYTGAGKLAISAEDEIVEEIRFALMECARDIAHYIHGLQRAAEQEERRQIFVKYIKEVAEAIHDITGKEKAVLVKKLEEIAKEKTALLEAGEKAEEEEEAEKILEKLEESEEKGFRGEDESKED